MLGYSLKYNYIEINRLKAKETGRGQATSVTVPESFLGTFLWPAPPAHTTYETSSVCLLTAQRVSWFSLYHARNYIPIFKRRQQGMDSGPDVAHWTSGDLRDRASASCLPRVPHSSAHQATWVCPAETKATSVQRQRFRGQTARPWTPLLSFSSICDLCSGWR